MKCKLPCLKKNIKKGTFKDSWLSIKRNSRLQLKNNASKFDDDFFFEDKPSFQELLTDSENVSNNKIEYSNYEQISSEYLNCKNQYDCFHGILSFIFYYSNNKFNTNEIEIYYSGSKSRKNLKMMNQNLRNQNKDVYDIINIFNYEDVTKEFIIGNYRNASFGINFKRIEIYPIAYSIQMGKSSNWHMNLVSFRFQGYDSKLNRWDTLDERENTNELNHPGSFIMFFTRNTGKSYSTFRIQQTSPNEGDFWGFIISAFDIHGNISYRTDIQEQNNYFQAENEIDIQEQNEQGCPDLYSYDPFMNMSEYLLI